MARSQAVRPSTRTYSMSSGLSKYLSTAEREHAKACSSLRMAEELEWENPTDPDAARRVNFWTKEVYGLSMMDPATIIPLH